MIKVPLCGSCCLPHWSWILADEELDLQLPVSLQEQDVVVVFEGVFKIFCLEELYYLVLLLEAYSICRTSCMTDLWYISKAVETVHV